jgi:RNA polymerase sigma factor (sigma-70 family)
MSIRSVHDILQYLRRTALPGEGEEPTDGQLLERFVKGRDVAALEVLVRRHGPMVWGVCRRILGNHHDAEDAFQATFLVLVRKAASIVSRELLANWLYGVALQTARKARQTAARRRAREKQVADMPEPEAAPQEPDLGRDLQPLLDQELSRLPDRYRVALVLCDLEGKSRKEAARQLGLAEGTVASRLARARAMLARRLARHGLAVSGGTLAAVLSSNAAPACVPAFVISSTIKVASLLATGEAAAGSISAEVAALVEGVMKAMFVAKLKAVVIGLSVVGLLLFGGLLTHHMVTAQQVRAEKLPPEDKKVAVDSPPVPAGKTDKAGEVKDVASAPLVVTVELPQAHPVRVAQPFQVRVRVVNSSQSPQSFRVANGSWEQHWQSSNDRVHWMPQPVFRNFIETVKLEPGQAYEKTGDLFLAPGKPEKEVRFKMGFTPQDSKQTWWSKEVTLRLETE